MDEKALIKKIEKKFHKEFKKFGVEHIKIKIGSPPGPSENTANMLF